jgi:hypothetical protein
MNSQLSDTKDEIIARQKLVDGDVQPESYYQRVAKEIIKSRLNTTILNYERLISDEVLTVERVIEILKSADLEIPESILKFKK